MENKQGTKHEPSSSSTIYCSTKQELDAASSSADACAVEDAEEPNSSQYWTSIKDDSESDDEGYVRVLPGSDVRQYYMKQIKLLEKIGEGGQGTIYTAEVSDHKFLRVHPVFDPMLGLNDNVVIAKVYKGRSSQWPKDLFGLHLRNKYVCQFFGYCLKGESFYLIMEKFHCSLRNLLDKRLMENKCKGLLMEDKFGGRPLDDISTFNMIIHIALGMCFLHENNILHRDLKADNVFVRTMRYSTIPTVACIGDFDDASKVLGSRFWRAPEVLQAMKERKVPTFTPEADVYSFAMTCYEILTGGIPLEEVGGGDYDAVLEYGMRPELPSNLNPKLKNFMRRCWHQDPESRPTFKEIVVELKELHRELFIGSEHFSRFFDSIFTTEKIYRLDNEANPEDYLLELKALFQALLVKYGEQDFLLLGLEIVVDMEQFLSEYGFRSFMEHPILPFRKYFARLKLTNTILWKLEVFGRINPYICESDKISCLLCVINPYLSETPNMGYTIDESDQTEREEIMKAWKEECDARVLPEARHAACVTASRQHKCDLCNFEYGNLVKEVGDDEAAVKSCLYVEEDLESLASSHTQSIRAPSSLGEIIYKTILVTVLLSMLLTSFLAMPLTNNDSHDKRRSF